MEIIKKELEFEYFEKMMGVNEKVILMFVIDIIGSMLDEIVMVKVIVKIIVDYLR